MLDKSLLRFSFDRRKDCCTLRLDRIAQRAHRSAAFELSTLEIKRHIRLAIAAIKNAVQECVFIEADCLIPLLPGSLGQQVQSPKYNSCLGVAHVESLELKSPNFTINSKAAGMHHDLRA